MQRISCRASQVEGVNTVSLHISLHFSPSLSLGLWRWQKWLRQLNTWHDDPTEAKKEEKITPIPNSLKVPLHCWCYRFIWSWICRLSCTSVQNNDARNENFAIRRSSPTHKANGNGPRRRSQRWNHACMCVCITQTVYICYKPNWKFYPQYANSYSRITRKVFLLIVQKSGRFVLRLRTEIKSVKMGKASKAIDTRSKYSIP